ncbi:MAG: hypothetical protein QGG42_07190 [Phycisphaerae bacterium]|nr:hypothetical protein [Phycisphaerae bacterium]
MFDWFAAIWSWTTGAKLTLDMAPAAIRTAIRTRTKGYTVRFCSLDRPEFWVELVRHVSWVEKEMSFQLSFRKEVLDAKRIENIKDLLERNGIACRESDLEKGPVIPIKDHEADALRIGILIQDIFSETLGLSLEGIVRVRVKYRGQIDFRKKTQAW